ncbi:hypothetical protein RTZ71_20850 [Rhodococcus qingshengii]|uniref:Uncharacterized protein n=1 Tax=Rhodococcus qingshengii TaxID=334542 RepID=A0AAW6LSK2_RHOSG|nr:MULTISPECIES: hypothetical protein [Rhodococcus]MDE8650014.1 hypothetical protein [Rhodococcus qingshengii]MDJ0441674.1 hypothetical protein [Rhodococcus qingshengii]MDT9663162.1 hypothetical protein [Rhodococcus qingshengii]
MPSEPYPDLGQVVVQFPAHPGEGTHTVEADFERMNPGKRIGK